MDNQHRMIKGYRELGEKEIALMNEIKEHGVKLGMLVDSMRQRGDVDARWLALGASQLQQGLMALTRSVAKPAFF